MKLRDTIIEETRFKGDACAICTAAASLLTELILGTTLHQLSTFSNDRLISALESDIKPSRLQCALLPLEALRAGMKELSHKEAPEPQQST